LVVVVVVYLVWCKIVFAGVYTRARLY